jgi:ubiquinone/menaquinone biosynthesis C-methylase UbiE
VCRLALHQVADPATVVRETVRVTRRGGRIGLVDMVAEVDRASAEEADRLERLRDPSHDRTLPLAEVPAGAALASTAPPRRGPRP